MKINFTRCNSRETEIKLIGITLDFKMKFKSNMSNVYRKSSQLLNVFFFNDWLSSQQTGHTTIYYSFSMNY